MIRRRWAAFAAAVVLLSVTILSVTIAAVGQSESDEVTITLPRPVAEALFDALADALATTTTSPPTTTTTVPPTTTVTTTPPTTTTVAPPSTCTGVQVAAGANLVTVANAQPAGTTFCLAAGSFITGTLPAQNADRWIGTLGAQGQRLSIITGNDSTRFLLNGTATDVVFRSLVIEKFKGQVVDNTNTQDGIFAGSFPRMLVDNVESRFNWGAGMVVFDGSIIRNSYIHHNRWLGITGSGSNALIEGNDISSNNLLVVNGVNVAQHDWGWSGGGMKLVHNRDVTLRGNHVYDNCGAGLWSDNVETGYLYEVNVIEDNFGPGIFHEISKSARITGNTITGNAHGVNRPAICNHTGGGFVGGILISNSQNVQVDLNTLADNDGGVAGIDTDRGAGQEHVTGLWVHDNDVSWTVFWHGCQNQHSSGQCYGGTNRYEDNSYHVGSDATPFYWLSAERTFAQWQSYGHDPDGSFD